MSHVVKLKVVPSCLDTLEAAAKECGLELRRGQKTYKWYGRWVKDYHKEDAAYKQGHATEDYGKCDHAIGIPGSTKDYEVGVIDNKDGTYSLIYDYVGGLTKHIGAKGEKLGQAYTKAKFIKEAEKKGFKIKKIEMLGNNEIQVHMEERLG